MVFIIQTKDPNIHPRRISRSDVTMPEGWFWLHASVHLGSELVGGYKGGSWKDLQGLIVEGKTGHYKIYPKLFVFAWGS